jgi:hypothetical protein
MLSKQKMLLVATAAVVASFFAGISATAAQGAPGAVLHRSASVVGIHKTTVRHDTVVSSNWAGYVANGPDPATPTSFSGVSARWVAPKATCTRGRTTYSAFWVGLGGFSETSQALEQIGTAADCRATGTAVYSMWYELVPAASVRIKYKVFPGNVITATVNVVGTKVTMEIRNLTRRTKFTKVLNASVVDVSSAEWVAEAPSSCDSDGNCVVLPLTNFNNVSFTSASATTEGHTGTISDPTWTASPIELVSAAASPVAGPAPQTSSTGAVPSALSSDGAAFTIEWQAAVSDPGSAGSGQSSRR